MLNLIKKTIAGIAIIVSLNSNAIAEVDCDSIFRADIDECVRITDDWNCYGSLICMYQREMQFYQQCQSDAKSAYFLCDQTVKTARMASERAQYEENLRAFNEENARQEARENAQRMAQMAQHMAQHMAPQNTNIPTPYPSSPSMYQYSNN